MDTRGFVIKACAVTAFGLFSLQGHAATISVKIDGVNDCAGYFGDPDRNGFQGCRIAYDGEELSPVIAKIDVDDSGMIEGVQTNYTDYPSIDGSEFTVTYGMDTTSGDWAYNGTAPDPNVKYWTTKAGNGFTLFWNVADSELVGSGACVSDYFNLACLSAAQHVTSGSWSTGGPGLSHITFYNSGVVPVPAAVWLFGSGLLGLVGVARRKRK